MKNLFKRNAEPDAPIHLPPVDGVLELVPASAKSPDAQRRTLFDPEAEIDESTDQDVAFLQKLLKEDAVQAAPRPQPRVKPAPPTPAVAAPADDLEFFRELAVDRQRVEVTRHIRVDNVDMGDLLEELQTTSTALRLRRKAA